MLHARFRNMRTYSESNVVRAQKGPHTLTKVNTYERRHTCVVRIPYSPQIVHGQAACSTHRYGNDAGERTWNQCSPVRTYGASSGRESSPNTREFPKYGEPFEVLEASRRNTTIV